MRGKILFHKTTIDDFPHLQWVRGNQWRKELYQGLSGTRTGVLLDEKFFLSSPILFSAINVEFEALQLDRKWKVI